MKRFLATFLTVAMVATSFPAVAFAEEENVNDLSIVMEEKESETDENREKQLDTEKIAEIQALIDALPLVDDFADMGEDEQEETLESIYAIYDLAEKLEDAEYLALDFTKAEEILGCADFEDRNTFAGAVSQISVSTEDELCDAIANATGTEENPTEIYINGSIKISSSVDIGSAESAKYIKIIGGTADAELVFSDSPTITYSSMLKVMYGVVELSNITLDANKKSRVLYVDGNGAAKLIINNGTTVKNGHVTGRASGAAIMAYGTVIMNGGLIKDCSSEYYGGAICVDNISSSGTFTMNDGKIDSCYSDSMGGAIHVRNGALYLNGGTISKCHSINGHYGNNKAAVWSQNGSNTFLSGSFVFENNQNGDIASPGYLANYYITSALENEIVLEGFDATPAYTQLLKSSEDYTLTNEDFTKVTLTDCKYTLYHNQVENSFDIAEKYVVTFHANDGSAEPATATQVVPKGIETALKNNPFERDGYCFLGWSTTANGDVAYADGAPVTTDTELTLYAKWAPIRGFCGAAENVGGVESVTWALDVATGTLTISGTGAMEDYSSNVVTTSGHSPWCWNRQKISKVIVEDGVTHIGSYAFASFSILESVVMADSVTSLGEKCVNYSGRSGNGITVTLSKGLASLNMSTFNAANLKGDLILTENIKDLQHSCLKSTPLTSITVMSDSLSVGDDVFASNGNLTAVDLSRVDTLTLNTTTATLFQSDKKCVVYVQKDGDATNIKNSIAQFFGGVHLKSIAVVNGGTFPEGTVFKEDELATPVKEGYVFGGWYTDLTDEETKTVAPAAGKIHYAKWTLKKPVITVAGDANKTYDGQDVTLSVPEVAGATYTWKKGKTVVGTNGNTLNLRDADSGSYTCTITVGGASETSDAVVVSITKANPELTLSANSGSCRINRGPVTFTYTYNGDGQVDVSSSNEAVATATASNGTVTVELKSVGTAAIKVSVEGSVNYNAAEATYDLTVLKKKSSSSSSDSGSSSVKPAEKPEEKPAEPDVKPEEKPAEPVVPTNPAEVPAAEKIVLTVGQRVANAFGSPVVNDVAPIIREDRTMLPIRFVAEALGATVTWDGTLQKVSIAKGDDVIDIYIGSVVAFVNGSPVELDSPAFIENGRTYLPLRFVAENLGATVFWDAETQEVTIVPNK